MKIMILFSGIIFMFLFLSACSNKEKTATLVIDNISISAEGPLFEGANTAQGEVPNRINAWAKEHGIELSQITSASLKKVTISVNDTSNLDLFSSINMQFASDQTDMIQAAVINKIQPDSKKIELTLSGEQKDLIKVLKQDKFTIVVDAILNKDYDANINLLGNIEIELKY